jgi:hypothetical protein
MKLNDLKFYGKVLHFHNQDMPSNFPKTSPLDIASVEPSPWENVSSEGSLAGGHLRAVPVLEEEAQEARGQGELPGKDAGAGDTGTSHNPPRR